MPPKPASAVALSGKEAQLVVAVLQHMAMADFKVRSAVQRSAAQVHSSAS